MRWPESGRMGSLDIGGRRPFSRNPSLIVLLNLFTPVRDERDRCKRVRQGTRSSRSASWGVSPMPSRPMLYPASSSHKVNIGSRAPSWTGCVGSGQKGREGNARCQSLPFDHARPHIAHVPTRLHFGDHNADCDPSAPRRSCRTRRTRKADKGRPSLSQSS